MRIGGVDGFLPYRPAATLMATALSPPPSIEEVAALRTPDLDRYLPPRRRPAPWQQRKRIELDFVHSPIVDLGLPDADRCGMHACAGVPAWCLAVVTSRAWEWCPLHPRQSVLLRLMCKACVALGSAGPADYVVLPALDLSSSTSPLTFPCLCLLRLRLLLADLAGRLERGEMLYVHW